MAVCFCRRNWSLITSADEDMSVLLGGLKCTPYQLWFLSLIIYVSTTCEDIINPYDDQRCRAQELCENRGGRPELPVPNSPYDLCGRKANLNLNYLGGRAAV